MSNDSDLSINFFPVGRHELGIYREPDTSGTSGLGLYLALYSVTSAAQPGEARLWFIPEHTYSSDTVGFAVMDISPVIIAAGFPLAELDRWKELLKGDQQVYFVYVARGPAQDGNTDVIAITLTTEHDPAHEGNNVNFVAARSRQALLDHLR